MPRNVEAIVDDTGPDRFLLCIGPSKYNYSKRAKQRDVSNKDYTNAGTKQYNTHFK